MTRKACLANRQPRQRNNGEIQKQLSANDAVIEKRLSRRDDAMPRRPKANGVKKKRIVIESDQIPFSGAVPEVKG